jgi:hypothetical protein
LARNWAARRIFVPVLNLPPIRPPHSRVSHGREGMPDVVDVTPKYYIPG